jgi:hypothetical protein
MQPCGELVGLGVGQAQGQFVCIHAAYSLAQLPAAFHDLQFSLASTQPEAACVRCGDLVGKNDGRPVVAERTGSVGGAVGALGMCVECRVGALLCTRRVGDLDGARVRPFVGILVGAFVPVA